MEQQATLRIKVDIDSKVLDGRDMGFKVALPYLPGMMFGMNAVQWKGIDGLKDQKDEKVHSRWKLIR